MVVVLALALGTVLVACGGSDDGVATSAEVPGESAPDFTMALADGTDFTLSAEQKPVYMVFWAEW